MKPNPQTDTPDSIAKFRGRIAPGSLLKLRDQNRLYEQIMGKDALVRQLRLGRGKSK